MNGKRWGRVGDSPIIGAGTYASNASCAVSGTGTGEYFIRLTLAREVCALMEYRGLTLKAAVDVAQMRCRLAIRYDTDVADRFLAAFEQVTGGHPHDPYWDLRAVLDLLPEHPDRPLPAHQVAALEDLLHRVIAGLGAPVRS